MSIADGDSALGEPLTIFILQLIIIVTLSRVLAFFFKYLKQPPVIAEVVAGILLGPSAFGRSAAFKDTVFPDSSVHNSLTVVANIGLILFMYMVGLELDIKVLKKNAKSSMIIAFIALVVPFGMGMLVAVGLFNDLAESGVSFPSFALFVSVAYGITAFPVLARILTESRMLEDRVGSLALGAAAVEDVAAWILLAVSVAIAHAKSPLSGVWSMLILVGFIIFLFLVVRPVLVVVARRMTAEPHMNVPYIAFFLILVLGCAWFTENIGVHAIFGAFAMGIITPRENGFAVHISERVEDLTITLLLPLYFTLSGLATNIASISSGRAIGYAILVIITACIGKIGSATITAKFLKHSWRESFTIGVLMNAKGLVELIVLNIGLQAKVLTVEIFTIFVIMCIVTTCMTSPLVYFIYLRPKKRQLKKNAIKETHSFFVLTSDVKTATDSLTCLCAFSKSEDITKVMYLDKLSERPSSYFYQFADNEENPSDVPILKDKTHNDILTTIEKHGSNQGMVVKTEVLTSNDVSNDVVNMVHDNAYNFVMFGVDANAPRDAPIGSIIPEAILPLNTLALPLTSIILNTQMEGYLGWHSVTTSAINTAKQQSNSRIITYLHRGAGLQTVKKIVVPYDGRTWDDAALEVVLLTNPTVDVDMYVSFDTFKLMETRLKERTHINIISADDPYVAAREGCGQALDGFTLLVVGLDGKDSFVPVLELIHRVTCCTVIAYPSITPTNRDDFNTVDISGPDSIVV